MESPSENLVALPFKQACKIKFDKGRAEHGPVFLLDPLVETYQEMLDSHNYMDEAARRGYDRAILSILQCTFRLCAWVVKRMLTSKTPK